MRVLVTGGSGRAGVAVVRALDEAGHEVVNVDRRPPREPLPGRLLVAELDDAGAVYDVIAQAGADAVCHLAAIPVPEGTSRVEVFRNNVLSTYYVLQAAADLGVDRVVYASSEMATGLVTPGAVPSRMPFDESERVPTPNAYGLSKYIAEVIAEALAVRHPEIPFVGLRLSLVVDADQRPLLDARRQDVAQGRDDFWGYIDARDVGTAFVAAVEGASRGHEVFLVAARDLNADRPLRELMAEFYDGYDAVDPGLPDDVGAFDCSKMEQFFGWRPEHTWRDGT